MTNRGQRGAPLLWPRIRSRVLRPLGRSSSPTPARESVRPPKTAVEMIGIGGHLAMSPLPHHRAYGSVPRRFGQLSGHVTSR